MEPFPGLVRHVNVDRVATEEAVHMTSGHSVSGHSVSGHSVSGHSVSGNSVPGSDLATLYLRQREAMIRLARLLTGSMVVAEEVVQDAFLRMHRQRTQPDNPAGYLRTTVVNISRSHLRRLRLERRALPPGRVTFDDPVIDETWAAVCRLPYRQRAVLALRFYEDLPEAEIARLLGCRLGTVKSSLHRGLAKLRDELT
jgi:RNA polymerase sigma factor (sigma-70 family)